MLTRCPHCDATFRVTEAHLNAAKGKVRCGACLKVFNALEHLSTTTSEAAQRPAPAPDAATQPPSANRPAPSPRAEPSAAASSLAAPSTAPASKPVTSEAVTTTQASAATTFQPQPDTSPQPDEAQSLQSHPTETAEAELLAELEAALREHPEADPAEEELAQDYQDFSLDSLLEEDEELKKALGVFSLDQELQAYKEMDEQALAEAEAELDAILAQAEADEQAALAQADQQDEAPSPYLDFPSSSPEPASLPEEPSTLQDDEEFLFQDNPEEDKEEGYYTGSLISDDELSDSFKELDKPTHGPSQFQDLDDEEALQSDESWAEEMLDELEANKAETELQIASEPEPSPSPTAPSQPEPAPEPAPEPLYASATTYDRLSPEPIALSESEPQGRPLRTLGWLLVNALLLVVLLGQLAWFHQDKLLQHEQLRSIYETVCDRIGCELPLQQDMGKIKSRYLSVLPHPSNPNALVLNILMVNEAPFAQPLPHISFRFFDLNGQVIAQRIFTPAEYLQGEARGLQQFPANNSVQISLEILKPGLDHDNYQVQYLPAPRQR